MHSVVCISLLLPLAMGVRPVEEEITSLSKDAAAEAAVTAAGHGIEHGTTHPEANKRYFVIVEVHKLKVLSRTNAVAPAAGGLLETKMETERFLETEAETEAETGAVGLYHTEALFCDRQAGGLWGKYNLFAW